MFISTTKESCQNFQNTSDKLKDVAYLYWKQGIAKMIRNKFHHC